ncbi:MAG: DUF502 domain-containing protein [Acidobacteria bacterium]|nr:MAG: DUF502 domain-containing protein [Acidobacteriota bacterium]
MILWLRRRFVAGFFVLVPLVISLVALIWVFGVVDGFTAPLYARYFDRYFGTDVPPGLGIVTTAVLILLVGTLATNVLGKRVLQRGEGYLLRIPVFRTVYAPVKQLVLAFSPDNEYGFKRVVMIRTESRGYILGFLTKEFSIQSAGHTESLIAVYVPTNHLYLGDVVICRRDAAFFPDLSVEEGIRVFLTGGMTLPAQIADRSPDNVTGRS